jgi:cell division protein ZapA
MKKVIRVEILGREYAVKSDEGEERVKKIAQYVNQKIKDISESTQTVSTMNAAILAAMNIANEYFQILEEKKNYRQDFESKAEHLISLIDDRIKR